MLWRRFIRNGMGITNHSPVIPQVAQEYVNFTSLIEPRHEKTCFNHVRSLISTFVVRCLNSIISLVSISKISRLELASVAAQAGLSLTWSKKPEARFSRDVAQFDLEFISYSLYNEPFFLSFLSFFLSSMRMFRSNQISCFL